MTVGSSATRQHNQPSKDELLALLRPWSQEHLLRFWDELAPESRESLAAHLHEIDFAQVRKLYQFASGERSAKSSDDPAELARRAEPPPAIRLGASDKRIATQAIQRGEQALSAGDVGVVLVAGGQGTRLGFDHPKGMFPIGPVSHATLFEILFEKLMAVGRRHGVRIPLYLMTSPATHDETVAALAEHTRFGLPADDVQVFCQGTMPAVDSKTGQLLLAAKDRLFLNPDGHGGMLAALVRSGALADIQRRGIKQLFYLQVDNPLVRMCDPEFIGHHLLAGSELSTQVVAKHSPTDRVGNVVSVDGKVRIIEYSDLPDSVAEQRLPDGSLKLWAGNIAVHVFDVAFLERMSADPESLPFHIARKKVEHVDDAGRLVEPANPNAIKFERFIFDLLPAARKAMVMEVDEQTTFAPVKNAPGAERDSPETVQRQMIALHKSWLEAAGATVAEAVAVEISPLFALDAQDVAAKVSPGARIDRDHYFK